MSAEKHRESPWSKRYEPHTMTIGKERINVFDVAPQEGTSKRTVFYGPGWAAHASVQQQCLPAFVEGGRRVIAVDSPHGIDAEQIPGFSVAESRKAQAVLKTLDAKGISDVDAVGHSEAALSLTAAALMDPKKRFRSITLLNPAGVIGKDTPPAVAARCVTDGVWDIATRAWKVLAGPLGPGENRHIAQMGRLVTRQQGITAPHPRHTGSEIDTLGKTEILDRLKTLKEQGVRIVIIQTDGDKTFPPKRSALTPDCYNRLLRMGGTHNEPIANPDLFMNRALQELDSLEQEQRALGVNDATEHGE